MCYVSQIVPYVMFLREEDGESGNVICRILKHNLVDCILRNIRSSEKGSEIRKQERIEDQWRFLRKKITYHGIQKS